jgi:hypothetical protein
MLGNPLGTTTTGLHRPLPLLQQRLRPQRLRPQLKQEQIAPTHIVPDLLQQVMAYFVTDTALLRARWSVSHAEKDDRLALRLITW